MGLLLGVTPDGAVAKPYPQPIDQ
ncbi:hypothetical protein NOCA1120223 [metagenome]|uniref:Uncharacterized protein n=1 Tax=metagenome TaxID=256318 RepID=A0A2P2C4C5_9ZZZZ